MAKEIAEGKGILVKRENAQELLAIRRGEVDLQSLIDRAENDIVEIDRLFINTHYFSHLVEKFILESTPFGQQPKVVCAHDAAEEED
jgi:hypothetical protein